MCDITWEFCAKPTKSPRRTDPMTVCEAADFIQPQMNTDSHRSAKTERIESSSFLSVSIRVYLWLMLIATCCTIGLGQASGTNYRRAHERQIIEEFTRLLAIPNIASDKQN